MTVGTLADIIESERRGVVNYTQNGACSNCGECCTDLLPLSDAEVRRIRGYIQAHGVRAYRNHVRVAAFDLSCPFRDEMARACRIYPARPEICRVFRCDHRQADVERDRELVSRQRRVVSMRETFFGEDERRDLIRR